MKKTKRILSVILSACLLITTMYIPYQCFAEVVSGKCGRTATYEFDDSTGTLTMSGTGEVTGSQSGCTGWKDYKDSITTLIIEEGITSIYQSTFASFTNLETIVLPQSLTSIGKMSFARCSSLKNLNIPENITKIEYCSFEYCGIEELTIPDNVEMLDYGSFRNCTSLKKLTIGKGLKTVYPAFIDCKNLEGVYISDLSAWASIEYKNYVSSSVSPVWFSKKLYLNNVLLTDLVIPEDVEEIKPGTFAYCESLKSITIPSTVKTIENNAFNGCINVTDVKISEGVESIGDYAFNSMDSIEEISIPKTVTNIGYSTFSYSKNLTAINVDPQSTSYSSVDGVLYNYDKTTLIKYPQNKAGETYSIPSTVTMLEEFSFNECKYLKSMVIPSNVETVGTGAFDMCSGIKELTIEDGVKTLGDRAFFYTCVSEIVVPKSVESIGNLCFQTYMKSTNKFYLLNPNAEIIENNTGHYTITAKTIYGYEGSTAQEYAESRNVDFVVVCNDGKENHKSVSSVTSPTCTEQGYTTYTCTNCGYEYNTSFVVATGHTEVTDDAVEPDCTNTGLTEGSHCSVCNEILTAQSTIDALKHNYISVETAPTCITDGYTTYTCERCGDSYKSDYTDALNHTYTNYVSDNNATCTHDGTKTAKCDRCGEDDTIADIGSMLEHTYIWEVVSKATYTQNGLEQKICSDCNKVAETKIIPMLKDERETTVTEQAKANATSKPDYSFKTEYKNFHTVAGIGCIKVAWSKDDDVSGYKIYTSNSLNGGFKLTKTVENSDRDFCVIQNLKSGNIIYIKIVAYKIINEQEYLSEATKTTKAAIK